MAFVCSGDEEKKLATLEAIAGIVKELQQEYASDVSPCCRCPTQPDAEIASDPPAAMICCRVNKGKGAGASGRNNRNNNNNEPQVIRLKQSKSRELRASIMYVGCDCEKRNGLQDDCQRTECHGSPECLTKPYPTCGPSEFCNGKHLGRQYPPIGKNTVSGGSYGIAGQNARPDNTTGDSIDCEYQCFPIDGLDLPCSCDENSYLCRKPNLNDYRLCPSYYPNSRENIPAEHFYPNNIEPIDNSFECCLSPPTVPIIPEDYSSYPPEHLPPIKPCIRDPRQALLPPGPCIRPTRPYPSTDSNFMQVPSCASSFQPKPHSSSNMLLTAPCPTMPPCGQNTTSMPPCRRSCASTPSCIFNMVPTSPCVSNSRPASACSSCIRKPIPHCIPNIRTVSTCLLCPAFGKKLKPVVSNNTCISHLGPKIVCWCYICNAPAEYCCHR